MPSHTQHTGLAFAPRAALRAALFSALAAGCGASDTATTAEPVDDLPEDAPAISRPSERREPEDDDAAGAGETGDTGDITDTGDTGGAGDATPDDAGDGGSSPGSDAGAGGGTADPTADDTTDVAPPLLAAGSSADDSLLYVMVWRDPEALGNGFAHDHVMRATEWAASFEFRANDPAACFVDVDVVTDSLLPDEPAMRSEVGLPGTLSESDRTQVRTSMLGEGQLEAEQFPTISFTSVACRGDLDGNGTLEVDGDLTIRDATQRVTWLVDYDVDEDGRMFASAGLTIAQTAFGITPYSAFFGAVRVADEVDLAFDLVGLPSAP